MVIKKIGHLKNLLMLIAWLGLIGQAFAYTPWLLPWVKIISRESWWATKEWLFADYQVYVDYLQKTQEQQKKLEKLRETDPSLYEQKMKTYQIEQERNQYLVENFPKEFEIDKTITGLDGQKLWTPFYYHFDKAKIIIHHTAWGEWVKTPEDAKAYIRSVYKQHALSNKRGDIGYNFIIDPAGNIYEGRAWGEWVVGMHAKYNNTASIWIALIGNFDKTKPTKEQLKSLIKLLVVLSKKYNINPTLSQTIYHKSTTSKPYIQDVEDFVIVWHQDAGHTSCPGKNLEAMLPKIREIVAYLLKKQSVALTSTSNTQEESSQSTSSKYKPKKYKSFSKSIAFDNQLTIKLDLNDPGRLKWCKLISPDSVELSSCKKEGHKVKVLLKREKYKASGTVKLEIETSSNIWIVKKPVIWLDDLTPRAEKIKNQYIAKHGAPKVSTYSKKITHKVYLSEQKKLARQNVKVLLWEASQLPQWNIVCNPSCKAEFDWGATKNIKSALITPREGNMKILIDGKRYSTQRLKISSDEPIKIANYHRKSYAGIPWNEFRWSLIFQKDKYKLLDGQRKYDWTVVNELPFEDYLKWVAESNDQVPLEKSKVMALLAKSYMLFYANKQNVHPSIPQEAFYNAVDDPRIFQKYVGAGFEKTSKTWPKALEWAQDKYVVYKGWLPILPYFNCSPGFTWSAKEKFWWLDTPYLRTRLDFYKCRDFKGHWVGLSGKWAEVLAKKWANAEFIIKYYYPGVEIVR